MSAPRHVALIMDGNGRWAAQRGWPRIKGHKAGVHAVQEILEAASDLGIEHLTLYAFSTENWKRPGLEVTMLMALLRIYLRMFLPKLRSKGIRFHHLGSEEGLPAGILKDLKGLEAETAAHPGMVFHLAVNYGSRMELAQAARRRGHRGSPGPAPVDRGGAGCGSPDPHLRRTAHFQFHALAGRLCGVLSDGLPLAGFPRSPTEGGRGSLWTA